ncbi:MAG TPA: hypothetical protein VIO64_08715 [Pseudobacteroides sp.]|uniref:hypothetical protein n=1 Tax=Pseudobacteroides sp. TaxID=1968840 RepID=UPI002F95E329
MNSNYDIKSLLEIIFNVTKKNAKILANQYLLKDVSIISKWRSNVSLPRNYDICKIVEFVDTECTTSQKRIIRDNIENLLNKSTVNDNVKNIVISMEDFNDFLREAISVSVSSSDKPNISEVTAINEDETNPVTLKAVSGKSENRYTGVVELDLVLPEGGDLSDLSNAGIEFKGKVNLTPRKRVIKVANYFRSRSVFGVVLVWVFTGILIALFTGLQNTSFFAFGSKSTIVQTTPTPCATVTKPQATLNSLIPTSAVTHASPSATPVHKPTPTKEISNNASTGNKTGNKNKTNVKTSNETNNTTNNTTENKWNNFSINIDGNNHKIVVGDENAVDFEKE